MEFSEYKYKNKIKKTNTKLKGFSILFLFNDFIYVLLEIKNIKIIFCRLNI